MATTEIFNYDNVRMAMSSVDESKKVANKELSLATEYLKDAIGSGADNAATAINGPSVSSIFSTWNRLEDEFSGFVRYVNETIEKTNQAHTANKRLEDDALMQVGK